MDKDRASGRATHEQSPTVSAVPVGIPDAWLPIETAPKVPILFYREGWSRPRIATWSGGTWWTNNAPHIRKNDDLREWWMPLPKLPEEEPRNATRIVDVAAAIVGQLTDKQKAALLGEYRWDSPHEQDEGEAALYRLWLWKQRPRRGESILTEMGQAVRTILKAQGTEARRAATTGAVHDGPVPNGDAPKDHSHD